MSRFNDCCRCLHWKSTAWYKGMWKIDEALPFLAQFFQLGPLVGSPADLFPGVIPSFRGICINYRCAFLDFCHFPAVSCLPLFFHLLLQGVSRKSDSVGKSMSVQWFPLLCASLDGMCCGEWTSLVHSYLPFLCFCAWVSWSFPRVLILSWFLVCLLTFFVSRDLNGASDAFLHSAGHQRGFQDLRGGWGPNDRIFGDGWSHGHRRQSHTGADLLKTTHRQVYQAHSHSRGFPRVPLLRQS